MHVQQGLSHQNHRSRRQGARRGYRRAPRPSLSEMEPEDGSNLGPRSRRRRRHRLHRIRCREPRRTAPNPSRTRNQANADPHPQAPSQWAHAGGIQIIFKTSAAVICAPVLQPPSSAGIRPLLGQTSPSSRPLKERDPATAEASQGYPDKAILNVTLDELRPRRTLSMRQASLQRPTCVPPAMRR